MTRHKQGERISVKAVSGKTYQYVWTDEPATGAMKDVYFAPDKTYVVAFFKTPQNPNSIERLENLVGRYRQGIFEGEAGNYWEQIYCWPCDLIRDGGKVGLIVPAYRPEFFFKYGSKIFDIKNEEKQGDWFTNPWHRYCNLDPRETGDWRSYFDICLLLARGIRRMHTAGLAHSDLSYKNVLIDPISHAIAIIDIDGLVVPSKFPPDVEGTGEFIAPEVYATMHLPISDRNRKVPCKETDLHALAVLIYMYLLCRHPLEGKKIWDMNDADRDKVLAYGEKAVFVENPKDTCNRYTWEWVKKNEPPSRVRYLFPWRDLDKLPYTVLGPYLKPLVERAFIDGLHDPAKRPPAFEWEDALMRTMDLLLPCRNASCRQKWFVFDNSASKPRCPFCGTPYDISLPALNLYERSGTVYRPANMRVMVYDGTRLYQWHSDSKVTRSEKLTDKDKKPVACFQYHQGNWYLRNESGHEMLNVRTKKPIASHSVIRLADDVQIRLGGESARVIHVQMVNGR